MTRIQLKYGRFGRSGGFAMVAGLLMILLVVAALVALIDLVAADVHRTRGEADGAQLRQLLLAGALDAKLRLDDSSAARANIELPAPLREDASVSVSSSADGGGDDAARVAHVRATWRGQHGEQTFRFQ